MTVPAVDPLLHADLSASDGLIPAKVLEVELTRPLPEVRADQGYRRAWILIRMHTEPVGESSIPIPAGGLAPDQLAAALWPGVQDAVGQRCTTARVPAPTTLTGAGLSIPSRPWPFLAARSAVLTDAPPISVLVCTRDRPDQLTVCLKRLQQQDYPRFEVVVVDNAPSSDAVRNLVEEQGDIEAPFRYCAEPRPGLSWARNAGVAAAAHEIVAFLDDDDEPDEHWLAGIAAGFAGRDGIGCVTGLILPARLDTPAEMLFEQRGGHHLGRGFATETFSRSGPQSPLFPLPPFGTGANMAFRRAALDRIGGFDVALGAGTPTAACEDTLAMTLTLLAGYEIAYEHSALMWHHHRPDMDSLRRQLHGYSTGLTAFYTALLRHRPGVLLSLLRLLPSAARYLRHSGDDLAGSPELADELDRRHLQGMLAGPAAYINSVRIQRRMRTSPQPGIPMTS